MDAYTFGLTLGTVGLGVMALSGLAHSAHASHGHASHAHTGHAGHDHAGHTPASHHGAVRHAPALGSLRAPAHAPQQSHAQALLWTLLSPRVLFSMLVGFGAAGLLLRPVLAEPWLLAASLGAGIAFERLAVAPLWRFLFRFASAPAVTLESCVADEARAVTGFDARGDGLVAVELDGQIVQLLATLEPNERATARNVRPGDRLRIQAVDGARNRCTVTYLGA